MSESSEMELDVVSAAESEVTDAVEVDSSLPLVPIPKPTVGDVPHATVSQMLSVVRALASLGGTATTAEIAAVVAADGISKRHTGYGLADGAEIIGLVQRSGGKWTLTNYGQRLSGRVSGSPDERIVLKLAMWMGNDFISRVVGGLEIPNAELHQLVRDGGFSESSAERRVSSLKSWRKFFETA